MAESRFGLRIPIAVVGTRPSGRRVVGSPGGRAGGGATRLRLSCEEGRQACPFGGRTVDSAHRWRRPHTTADRRRARVRPGLMAVSAVCHSAVCRPDAGTERSFAD
jgi:hypothetical protein